MLSCVWLWPCGLCSPQGSSVHGILQVRILGWVAISISSGSSWPRDQTLVSWLQTDSLPSESPGKPQLNLISSQWPHLQTLSHWGLGAQHKNWGDTNIQSIASIWIMMFNKWGWTFSHCSTNATWMFVDVCSCIFYIKINLCECFILKDMNHICIYNKYLLIALFSIFTYLAFKSFKFFTGKLFFFTCSSCLQLCLV